MSYSCRIDNVDVKALPVNNYSSTTAVVPAEGGKSTVEWRGAFYRGYPNNDPPPELNDEAALKAVDKVYRAGLEGLKKSRGLQVNGVRASAWFAGVCAAILFGVLRRAGPNPSSPIKPAIEVSVLDLGSKQVVARIPVLGKPAGIAMAAMDAPPMSRARKANMSR